MSLNVLTGRFHDPLHWHSIVKESCGIDLGPIEGCEATREQQRLFITLTQFEFDENADEVCMAALNDVEASYGLDRDVGDAVLCSASTVDLPHRHIELEIFIESEAIDTVNPTDFEPDSLQMRFNAMVMAHTEEEIAPALPMVEAESGIGGTAKDEVPGGGNSDGFVSSVNEGAIVFWCIAVLTMAGIAKWIYNKQKLEHSRLLDSYSESISESRQGDDKADYDSGLGVGLHLGTERKEGTNRSPDTYV